MKLAAARIWVDDLAVAEQFYAQILRLPLKAGHADGGFLVFDAEGTDLIVETVESSDDAEASRLIGRFTGLSFHVNAVHDHYEQMRARGVSFAAPPEQQVWGGWLVTFSDPSGNQLQLVQYPSEAGNDRAAAPAKSSG